MMWPWKRSATQNASRGFTIIELLIVIVIIAILAAITIVAYNGITNKANSVSAQSAAKEAYEAVSAYMATNADQVPTTLAAANVTNQGNTSYQYSYNNTVTPQTFCLTATTANVSYYVDNGSHNTPTAGACAGQAPNGGTVVTNLATDPRATRNASIAVGGISWASDWFGSGGATGTITSVSGAADGPASQLNSYLRKTWTTAPTGVGNSGFSLSNGNTTGNDKNGYPVIAGQTFTISWWFRSSRSGMGADLQYFWHDASGNVIGTSVYSPVVTLASGVWARISATITAPTSAVYMNIRANISGGPLWQPGDTLDGTGLMVTTGPTVYNYADGNSSGWAWTGTPNSSTSTGPTP